MHSKVRWSRFSWIVTIVITCLLIIGLIACRENEIKFFTLAIVTFCIFLSMWFLSPTVIVVSPDALIINRRIGCKKIPLSDIASVARYTPQLWASLRLCGSGGFAGYWGWFSDHAIGTYFAQFGDRHDCFLVTLTNGRKYMIGCDNPDSMVSYLRPLISKNKA